MLTPSLEASAAEAAIPGLSDALSDRERWCAVHALPFAEARAECQLQRQGFRTFQPKRRKTVRHARKTRTVEAPFFPRYLFCHRNPHRNPRRTVDRW